MISLNKKEQTMSVPVEIVKALVLPAEKLITAVQSAIGKIYEPHYIKKMAQAKAQEIELLGNAVRNNSDLSIVISDKKIKIKNKELKNLILSTQQQELNYLLKQYINKSNIADKAYDILMSDEANVKIAPEFKTDWFEQFFDCAKNISDEDIQLLWARILASEIKKSESYSIRTLNVLQSISKSEALTFEKVCEGAVKIGKGYHIPCFFGPAFGFKLTAEDLLLMEECGLVHSITTLKLTCTPGQDEFLFSENSELAIFAKCKQKLKPNEELSIDGFQFTKCGNELIEVIGKKMSSENFVKFAKKLKSDLKIFCNVHVYKIINHKPLQYDKTVDLLN